MIDLQTERVLGAIFDDLCEVVPPDGRCKCPVLVRLAYIVDNARHANNVKIMEELGAPLRHACGRCSGCGDHVNGPAEEGGNVPPFLRK
jgi:hypothetical protein